MKLKKFFKAFSLMVAAVMICGVFASCGHVTESSSTTDTTNSSKSENSNETEASFVITLYPKYAPITCENFEKLVKEKFYDGLTFHRIIDGFMAQGGESKDSSKEADTIKGEFINNGVDNKLSHKKGIVSMARLGNDNDSASSQFFICFTDDYSSTLDKNYAAFGKVTEGMENVEKLQTVKRTTKSIGEEAEPVYPVTIQKAEMIDDDENGNHRVKFTITFTPDNGSESSSAAESAE